MEKEEGKKKQITESRLEEALSSRVSYFHQHAKSLNMSSVRRMLEEDLGIEKFALDVHRRFIKQFVVKDDGSKNLVENSGGKDEKLKAHSSKAETGSREEEEEEEEEESSNETKVGVVANNVENKTDIISESSIKKAILERAHYFSANSNTLQLGSARRLLEGDLGLEIYALDPFKKFITREMIKVVAAAVASEASFERSKDISGESWGRAPDASGSEEKSESRDGGQNWKGPGIKGKGQVEEDSLIRLKGDKKVNGQGMETSESTIKQAILDQVHYFRSNANTLTLAGSRRFLEEKLGLAKNALDPFKKFIGKQMGEVLSYSLDVDVKKPNKATEAKNPKQLKRPKSPETEETKSSKKTKKNAPRKSTKKIDSDEDSEPSEPKSSKKTKKDATRKSTKKIDPDEPKKSIIKACGMGNLQYRCAVKGICEIFEKIHNDLRREHLDLLYKTPFRLLFKALYEKRICKKNRNDDVLDQIILSYNPKKKQFKIGKKYSKIYKSEIQLIFGIQDGKIRVDNNKCSKTQTGFTERNFPGVKKVTVKMIKEQIVKVVVKTDEDSVQDTVRLLCLLLFQNWFFSTTGQVLGWTYVKYVEDLSKLNSYDWTYIIHKNLIDCLDEKSKSPQKVNGCTLALWYWFCERCKLIKPKEDEVAIPNEKDVEYKGIPRATKWEPSNLNEVFSKFKLSEFKEDEFSWNKLRPTKAELKQLMPNTKKDKLSGKNKTQENEDDHHHDSSVFQESTPKKKRANAVESSSRKKGKYIAYNDDDQENMKVLNLQQEREISRETPEKDVDSDMVCGNVTEITKSFVKMNGSSQTEELDPREEEMQRRELQIQILKARNIILKSVNNELLKKMKQCEDKEKASNEMAERATEQVVSLKARIEQLEKDKEEEIKTTLRTILNGIEAVGDQMQQELA